MLSSGKKTRYYLSPAQLPVPVNVARSSVQEDEQEEGALVLLSANEELVAPSVLSHITGPLSCC